MLSRLNVSTGISVLDKFLGGSDCQYSRQKKKTDRAYSVLDKFLGGTDCHYSRRKKKDRA